MDNTREKRLIDANDPLKQISDYTEKLHCSTDYIDGLYRGMEIAESYIKNATTVDAVEVVHGKWLYDSGTERHFCSACNEYAMSVISNEPVYEYDWEENLQFSHIETACDEQLTNYCQNCGAKMGGADNG